MLDTYVFDYSDMVMCATSFQSDGDGYPPDWFQRQASEALTESDPEEQEVVQSSPMYRLHMQSRSFEDQVAMREDIRRINLYIEGVEQNYTIVDRLGEGKLLVLTGRRVNLHFS